PVGLGREKWIVVWRRNNHHQLAVARSQGIHAAQRGKRERRATEGLEKSHFVSSSSFNWPPLAAPSHPVAFEGKLLCVGRRRSTCGGDGLFDRHTPPGDQAIAFDFLRARRENIRLGNQSR